MYKDSLKRLREQVFAAPEENTPTKNRGIIQARVESKPLSDARVTPYSDWLQTISSMVEDIKQSAPEAASGKSGFAQGFADTVDFSKKEEPVDPLSTVPEGNKEALIERRGDLPSFSYPGASKEKNSHEARISATDNTGFRGLIDKHEGGGDYDTLYSFANRDGGKFSNVKISQMTIGELKNFANGEYGDWAKGKLGYKATPMGRYQFVGSTMAAVAKKMGLPDDTVFDAATQDAMFDFHVKDTMSKGKSVDAKVNLLRGQWEGFKNVPRSTLADLVVKYG